MKENEQKKAAKEFAAYWKDKGYEKGESQAFWLSFLRILGVDEPEKFITFEDKVMLDHTSFIDGKIPSTHVLIEQKSKNKDLRKAIVQSDGSLLTPFQQAKRYSAELPYSERPRWIVTCNFQEFLIYDMEKPTGEPESILLKDLPKEYYRFKFIVETGSELLKREKEVSMQAGEIVGILYDKLLEQYIDPDDESLKSLNALCVRLVFCLYAEDADIFGKHLLFHDYLKDTPARGVREALIKLFKVLDTPEDKRDKYLAKDDPILAAFPYVNGGLFADENIEIPPFTEELKDLLLKNASEDFDWSGISPTIFGAVFESTLNPETRRTGGMHYTSIENIHKVIDPLFLDDLKAELDKIIELKVFNTKKERIKDYIEKLSRLKFLDPACGSGNFLTETYISLRRLENRALEELYKEQVAMGETTPIKVSIGQFYGIEINDFAVTVAKTALWIAESQTMKDTIKILHMNLDFLPLRSYANIIEGNALRIDWKELTNDSNKNTPPRYENSHCIDYIMGNPPFVGARYMSKEQKNDLLSIFSGWKNAGNLDYVCCWYKKSADYMQNSNIRAALVSTNSISQGESVANLWKPLFESGVHIDFAHRTFRWDSEASIKAHVHCVIIGFSTAPNSKDKVVYTSDRAHIVKNINGYLIDADNVFIDSRNKPLCDAPTIGIGNQPIDNGNYLFAYDEMLDFIKKEPAAEKWFRPWYGAQEFINRKPRYCLWLGNCPPSELRKMPECMKRIEAVKIFRQNSKRTSTKKLSDTPTKFQTENMPDNTYLLIPRVSSERRRYVPIGFMTPDTLCSDAVHVISNATLYHFGVLTSNVHMAWMRTVAGRLEMRYRYSKDIVYNNFPWPSPTLEQKAKIERTAQGILDARALYPDSSLADLYDELTMPSELRRAHQDNDRTVMNAYGFDIKTTTESSCVAELMRMYQKLTEKNR